MTTQTRLRNSLNALKVVKQIRLRDENNVLRVVMRVRIRDGSNFIRTVFQSIVATVNPAYVSGSFTGTTAATANITTGSAQALVSGGVAPFTTAWAQVVPSPYAWTINSPALSATSFTAQNVESGVYTEAQFQATITDANGATATAIVTAGANNQGSTTTAVSRTSGSVYGLDTQIP